MIIKKLHEVPFAELQGYDNVKKQVVIGPDDGSEEIILRYFRLAPGGASPHHTHPFPHLVKIEVGSGIVIDPQGKERPVQAGDYIYINDEEKHQFRNTGTTSLEFICIVPRRGEM